MIDWSKMVTPEAKALAELTAWRESATLTRLQFKAILLDLGKLDEVEALIAASDDLTRLKWVEASQFDRAEPLIDTLGAQIGLTPEDIDALYRGA